ncbi:MAG: DNA polymerase I [Mariprofundaceae bacterium]|nr:DNA polymerase I [Mariprofundaceae bacterium]
MPHLVLIDGPNYVYRAFHAVKHNLSNSKGEPTNAIFGYVQMLRSILKDLSPTHVAVIFDPKGGTFRNDMYPDYKAHRPPMPEDLAAQWQGVFDITDAFNIARICVENYEADDVIATLAKQAETKAWDVTIVSTDKDLMQLVSQKVWMLDTMRHKEYGVDEVKEKWGVEPVRVHDLLALAGDSADNIPGVPGIGPKTALDLLNSYGDLEGVLQHAPAVKQKKRRENLIEFADDARLSYRLVALDCHTPLPLGLDDLQAQAPNRPVLVELFKQLEFRRLMDEFSDVADVSIEKMKASESSTNEEKEKIRMDHLVDSDAMLCQLVEALKQALLIAVDTETTSLHCHDAALVGLSFAVQEGEGWYVPIAHRSDNLLQTAPKQLDQKIVLAALTSILEDPNKLKCGHNLKYDTQVLRRAGISLRGISADSMLLAYVDEPGQAAKMDKVAKKYLDYDCIAYEEVAGKGAKQITFDLVPISIAAPYASEDAEVTLRLTHALKAKLTTGIARHDGIELPLAAVLADMEWVGAYIDAQQLNSLSEKFGARIQALESQIHTAAGEEFNIQSPKQLGVLLFETLAIAGGKKTKSGQWATGQGVLEKLADSHEVPRLILEVRGLSKLKSTYTDALPKLIHPQTGRVHTSYNQAVTTTGRLSSSNPNLQNIPIRTAEGREIRKAFVAEKGNVLIAADYSQIELRLMAHFSQDANLMQAFAEGRDIHAATAAAINQLAIEDVDGEMRRQAKAVNFGILYGMSAFGLAKQLNVSRSEAKLFIETYFEQFPTVQGFMNETLVKAREQGYVETLMGHRMYVPDINSSNGMRKSYAERTAINAPLQGSAADIIKIAMIALHQRLNNEAPDAKMILQVHDELIVECPHAKIEVVTQIMREEMEHAVSLNVPLIVDIGMGTSWFEAHSL